MLRRYLVLLGILLSLVLILAGCGGKGSGTPGGGETKGAAQEKTESKPTSSATSKAVKLTLASFDMGTSTYVAGSSIADLLKAKLPAGSTIDVLPYSGQVGNPQLVSRGEAKLGLGFSASNKWAYDGVEVYDKKIDNLRGLMGGFGRFYVAVIVRQDSPINSLREVADKQMKVSVMTDPPGSMGAVVGKHILEAYGITTDKLKARGGKLDNISQEVAAQRITDRQGDVWIKLVTVGHPKVAELATTTAVRFLAIDDAVRQALAGKYGYEAAKPLPAKSFNGQDADVPTLSFPNELFTSKDLPDDLAYLIVKTLAENKDALVKKHAQFKDLEPEKSGSMTNNGLPLHPGAAKYFQEKGWAVN